MYYSFGSAITVLVQALYLVQGAVALPGSTLALERRITAERIERLPYDPKYYRSPDKPTYYAKDLTIREQMAPGAVEAQAQGAYQLIMRRGEIDASHDTLIVAALFVPKKGIYYATQPLGAGNRYYKDRGAKGMDRKTTDYMHAEAHAIAKAEADDAHLGPGCYVGLYGHLAGQGPKKQKACTPISQDCTKMLNDRQIGHDGHETTGARSPNPEVGPSTSHPGKGPSSPAKRPSSPGKKPSSSSQGRSSPGRGQGSSTH